MNTPGRRPWAPSLSLSACDLAEERFSDLYDLACSCALGARGEAGINGGASGDTLRLVPMLDMAQHCPSAGGQFALRGDRICLLACRSCEEGVECYLDYKERTSDEFALQYGFVPERNLHDALTLPVEGSGSRQSVVHVDWSSARSAPPWAATDRDCGTPAWVWTGTSGLRPPWFLSLSGRLAPPSRP